ncbi:hypothetical protein L2E82_05727 [Cichorium intybus]|uniref:Uncharacterized protein n=1 Tax=Cichorium intybus TaxID=13427 RepID=A0ACB9H8V2_CICIN|nr:hypothetical protein L2E82_05727 [Cichorium intybus]
MKEEVSYHERVNISRLKPSSQGGGDTRYGQPQSRLDFYAVLGLDDIRAVQPFSPINDIEPTPIFLNQHAVDSLQVKFPYLVQRKLKAGQEVRCVAQLDWKIIEIRIRNCTPTGDAWGGLYLHITLYI